MSPLRRQAGVSMTGVLTGVIIFIVVATSAFKVVPVVTAHMALKNAVASLEISKADATQPNEARLKQKLRTTMRRNGDYEFDVSKVSFSSRGAYLEARIKYDAVSPLAGKVSLMLHFDDVVDIYPK